MYVCMYVLPMFQFNSIQLLILLDIRNEFNNYVSFESILVVYTEKIFPQLHKILHTDNEIVILILVGCRLTLLVSPVRCLASETIFFVYSCESVHSISIVIILILRVKQHVTTYG